MIQVEVKYEAGHTLQEQWEARTIYCPNCGAWPVWHEANTGGDYYVGELHLCLECSMSFTIQGPAVADGWQDAQRLAAIGKAQA